MSKYNSILIIPICLSIIACVSLCYADIDYEDLVDITKSNGKIFGFVSSGASFSLSLKGRERIQWSDSKGLLGAFLTNFRFFVISDTSNAWQVFSLKLNEAEGSAASLSATVALLVTDDRAIGFDGKLNRFVETQIPIRDDVIAAETGDHIALVVTSSRVFGMASGFSSFAQVHFKLGETVESVKVTSTKATITTQDRLLIFLARSSLWKKIKLN